MESTKQKQLLCLGAAAVVIGLYKYKQLKNKRNRQQRPRRMWVREIYRRRKEQGLYENLIQEMRLYDPELFFNFTRISVRSFDMLLMIVGPHIAKHSPREPIAQAQRLILTLRFLATGDSYPSLAYSFRIAPSTICKIIREVCNVLWEQLSIIYLKPLTVNQWLHVKEEFFQTWQWPNYLGAIDGKHIAIQAPAHSGSLYYNYKKYFSIVLLGVCDANYFFTVVDVGAYGAQSDGGILKHSTFGKKLKDGTLNIPPSAPLPHTNTAVPMFFVGDEAFPLQINLLRPYSKRSNGRMPEEEHVFNYRLSRARRTIENAFGILAARFRIFHRVINAAPETVDSIVKATTCLHNFIKSQPGDAAMYCGNGFVDQEHGDVFIPGQWRKEVPTTCALQPVTNIRYGNRNAARREAWELRDYVKTYVNNLGSSLCPWQLNYIRRTECN